MLVKKKIAKRGKQKWARGLDTSKLTQEDMEYEAKKLNIKDKVKNLLSKKKEKGEALFK